MTTQDHLPPTAETEERNERVVSSARDAQSSGGRSESNTAQREWSTGSAETVTSQPAPSVAPYAPSGAPTQSATDNQPAMAPPGDAPAVAETPTGRALFADDELAGMRARWDSVQAGFVDDPKDCVHKADGLVSDLVDRLTNGFSEARSRLEENWARGEEASTEDLRVALKQYRDFFERLLAV